MKILETERLILRELTDADDKFTLNLLNQPSFIKYIGDRGVRTVEEARNFIETRYQQSYRENGFGLYAVDLKAGSAPTTDAQSSALESEITIGICGFVRRKTLPETDIGFAFLPEFEKKGYAFESADAVMKYGRDALGFKRVLAITSPDNESSGRLLGKLGFKLDGLIKLAGDDEEIKLFSWDAEV